MNKSIYCGCIVAATCSLLIADNHGKLLRRIEGDAASNPKTLADALGAAQ
jgi:gas vesicle protein